MTDEKFEAIWKKTFLVFIFAFLVLGGTAAGLLLYMLFVEVPAVGLSFLALFGAGYIFAEFMYPKVKDV